jgi:hypothetical protein
MSSSERRDKTSEPKALKRSASEDGSRPRKKTAENAEVNPNPQVSLPLGFLV